MKNLILTFIAVMGFALFIGCAKKIESTDLSNVYLDSMTIGTSIERENLINYTASDKYSGDYKYKFEEIIIDTNDNNEINYLFARFDEDHVDIEVNDRQVKTVDDLKEILGNNYLDRIYDREQKLNEYIYEDNVRNIKAEFIYSTNDNCLCWIILSK